MELDNKTETEEHEPLNVGDILDHGDTEEFSLPFRIRCLAHAFNLLGSKDAAKAEGDKNARYKTVSQRSMLKARHLWKRQGVSNVNADIIENHCGGCLQKPNNVRWNAVYEALMFLKKKIEEKPDNLSGLLNLQGERAFTQDELQYLSDYALLMKPVTWGLNKLQGDIGLGYALPTIVMVRRKIQETSCPF